MKDYARVGWGGGGTSARFLGATFTALCVRFVAGKKMEAVVETLPTVCVAPGSV